jgi:cytidine deaminase
MKSSNYFLLLSIFFLPSIIMTKSDTIDYELIQQAIAVRNNAQAPYSGYHVGACVKSQAGVIYKGCNVERVSYTQTTHAEQNAVDSMVAGEGPAKIQAIAVAAAPADCNLDMSDFADAEIIYGAPQGSCCGHCLQIIWENCLNDKDVVVYFVNRDKKIYVTTVGTLLPYPFGPCDLGIDYKKK